MNNLIKELFRKIKTYLFVKDLKSCGSDPHMFFPVVIEGGENVTVGDNVSIGSFVHMWGHGGIDIGSDVLIAAHCCISLLGHE